MSTNTTPIKSCSFLHFNRCMTKYKNPLNSFNYKLNTESNTNFANLSRQMRIAQRLRLDGAAQTTSPVARINNGITHFGNFYLGKTNTLNYLGRMEGQSGGSGSPPRNKF